MTMLQTAALLGMGISQAMIAICPKGLIRETMTWLCALMALGSLAAYTVTTNNLFLG